MQLINSEDGRFSDPSPVVEDDGTPITAEWLNVVQDELVGVIEAAGMALNPSNNGQLAVAVKAITAADAKSAQAAADAAVAARDAAVLNVPVYDTITAGLAAVAVSAVFAVKAQGSDGLPRETRFRKDGASTYTKLSEVFTAEEYDARFKPMPTGTDVTHAIVDATGKRSWLEINDAGGPTANAGKLISRALQYDNLSPEVKTEIDNKAELLGFDIPGFEEFSLTMADATGKRSWLEVGLDGGPTPHSIHLIATKLQAQNLGVVAIQYAESFSSTYHKTVAGPEITCWGDSMTAGAGGGGTTYPGVLASLSGRTVNNAGVGGETSVTICARSGATPFIVSVQDGVIPASGGVVVTFAQINGQSAAPLLQGTGTPGGTFAGTLAGVPGTITQSGGTYTFTRTTAGAAVTCNRPAPYYTDWAKARRDDVWIMWIGQNGPSDTRAIQDIKAMIQHVESLNKRWLVIPRPTSTDAVDSSYFAEFGRRCIMARKYLVDYGLSDAGITPTAQDLTDISNGVVPSSLRFDAVHWNAAGYTILGNLVYQRMVELGWL